MKNRMRTVVAALFGTGLLAACGDDEPSSTRPADAVGTPETPRTIEVTMVDIAFEPAVVTVQAGETVRFLFTNTGAVDHEATFGDADEQEQHAAEMREADGMEMHEDGSTAHAGQDDHGDDAVSLVLQPGESGEVTTTFDDPGMSGTIVGCHEPGHWEAGMRLDVVVAST